jgi:tetratricopeptide (TPR) repeat protein
MTLLFKTRQLVLPALVVSSLLAAVSVRAGQLSDHSPSLSYSMSPFLPATLRRHYQAAAADKAAGEKFYQLLADYQDNDALVLGYKAAAEAIRARDASMFNKLTYVQQAARTFEQAVTLDPKNAEIRFLRFSVESNLPAFLGLSKHVEEDRALLLQSALAHPQSGLDPEAFRTVRSFLVDRGHVSEEEAKQLNKVTLQ